MRVCACTCMCVCACVCVCVCVPMSVGVHVPMGVYMCEYVCVSMRVCIRKIGLFGLFHRKQQERLLPTSTLHIYIQQASTHTVLSS